MAHVPANCRIQFWLCAWIWQLRADQRVHIRRRAGFVTILQDDQNMGVRQSSLLKLNGPCVSNRAAHYSIFDQVIHESSEL